MEPGPSKAAETLLAILIPPACREHVLGDLQERYVRPSQYFTDALSAVPVVILSRIRRVTDPQVLLIEAFALYLAFTVPAYLRHEWAFIYSGQGLVRLAVPAAAALLALVLAGAYADPKKRSPMRPAWQSVFAVACALASQTLPLVAIPLPILLYGACLSLPLVLAIRFFFAREDNRPTGAG